MLSEKTQPHKKKIELTTSEHAAYKRYRKLLNASLTPAEAEGYDHKIEQLLEGAHQRKIQA